MKKITFSVTTDEAKHISTAIAFLFTACTKATPQNPDGINQLNQDNMKLFDINRKQLDNLVKFGRYMDAEIYLAAQPETLNSKL